MESYYLLILLFFILILVFPLTFTIRANYNIWENHGAFSIKLWFLWFKIAKVRLQGTKLILTMGGNQKEEKNIEISDAEYRFLIFFQKEVRDKVKIRELELISHIGGEDAFQSAMLSGFISAVVLGVFSRWKINSPTASFRQTNFTDFNHSVLEVSIKFRFAISIFDVLYSFLISVLRNKRDDLKV